MLCQVAGITRHLFSSDIYKIPAKPADTSAAGELFVWHLRFAMMAPCQFVNFRFLLILCGISDATGSSGAAAYVFQ